MKQLLALAALIAIDSALLGPATGLAMVMGAVFGALIFRAYATRRLLWWIAKWTVDHDLEDRCEALRVVGKWELDWWNAEDERQAIERYRREKP